MTEIGDPKLSICIPTYNRAALLERMLVTLELALSKVPEASYEVVFRDNASTDHTRDIITQFGKRHPVRYSRNDENIGVMRNILSVPLDASGEFVWMLGDDDLGAPEAFVTIFQQLEEAPDVDEHIAAHAIMYEDRREESEKMILKRN